ncbi:MAG: hypothetical protein AB1765_04795 [Candidatus Hydrogenedentota bacterium]
MKKTEEISNALIEVWEWKDKVYQDIKNKSFKEKQKYFNDSLNRGARRLNGKLKSNPDGSYQIVI